MREASFSTEELLQDVARMLDIEGTVKMEQTDNSDVIKSNIIENNLNSFEAEGDDDTEDEKKEEIECKIINEIKVTFKKAMQERDIVTEKYMKYKLRADQTRSASGITITRLKNLEDAYMFAINRAKLRETLLDEERRKNEMLEAKCVEFQTKIKMLAQKLTFDNHREVAVAMFDTIAEKPPIEGVNKAIIEAAVMKEAAKESKGTNPSKKVHSQSLPSVQVQKEVDMKTKMQNLLCDVKTRAGNVSQVFSKLPTKKALPDYYDVIKMPMDVSMIQKKITSDQYANMLHLQNDFVLMLNNAQKYYLEGSEIFNNSITLMKALDREIMIHQDLENNKPKDKESELEADLPKHDESPLTNNEAEEESGL